MVIVLVCHVSIKYHCYCSIDLVHVFKLCCLVMFGIHIVPTHLSVYASMVCYVNEVLVLFAITHVLKVAIGKTLNYCK